MILIFSIFLINDTTSTTVEGRFNITNVTTISTTTTIYYGRGGVVGGGAIEIKDKFSINPILLKIEIKRGETLTRPLIISSLSEKELNLSFKVEGLKDFIELDQEELILKPEEMRTLFLHIYAPYNMLPDVYTGEILIHSKTLEEKIKLVLEVKSRYPLFDVKVNIPKEYKEVVQGDGIGANITLINMGDKTPVDVFLKYSLLDMKGNKLVQKEETISIKKESSIFRYIEIPKDLNPDFYVFYAKLIYSDQVAVGSDYFELVSRPKKEEKGEVYIYYIIILIVQILILLSALYMLVKKEHI